MKFLTGRCTFICEHTKTTQNKFHFKHKKGALIESYIFTKVRNNRLLVRSIAGTALAASLSYGIKELAKNHSPQPAVAAEASDNNSLNSAASDLPDKSTLAKAEAHLQLQRREAASRSQLRHPIAPHQAHHVNHAPNTSSYLYAAWTKVAECEEGGWVGYSGYAFPNSLGITRDNWFANGGGSDVSPAAQIRVAERLIHSLGISIPDQNGCQPGGW